jgi:cell division protein FtsI/penicillin-binding protein 2
VNRKRKKIKIPKKGRIRFFLLVLLLFAGLQAFRHHDFSHTSFFSETKTIQPIPEISSSFSGSMNREELADLLKQFPLQTDRLRDTISFGDKKISRFLSIDTLLQNYGEKLFSQYAPKYGALVAIEPASGRILSLITFSNKNAPAVNTPLYCRNIFPAASVFKTIAAASAIESEKLNELSLISYSGRRHTLYRFQIKDSSRWGEEMTLIQAFANSVNPIFGKIGSSVLNYEEIKKSALSFGFQSAVPFELCTDSSFIMPCDSISCDSSYVLAELASGFNKKTKLTPLLGALIASCILENGNMPQPSVVDSVLDIDKNKILYKKNPSVWKKSMKVTTAEQLEHMMMSVVEQGTARKSFKNIRLSAVSKEVSFGGKTGSITADGLGKIDWFIGFAKHNMDPSKRIAISVVTVHGDLWTVHSSLLAAEIFNKYLRNKPTSSESSSFLAQIKPAHSDFNN